jgi:preprotein translocase subunit YajC
MSSLTGMLPLVLMFVVLYFVMIRPQMKRQKEHRAMIDALAKGDEVVTAGGMLGKVRAWRAVSMGVEIAAGVEVQIQRASVVQVLRALSRADEHLSRWRFFLLSALLAEGGEPARRTRCAFSKRGRGARS